MYILYRAHGNSHHCRCTAEDVNYYGTKRMLQVLKPLLKPKSRSVGISSSAGQLGVGSWHAGARQFSPYPADITNQCSALQCIVSTF